MSRVRRAVKIPGRKSLKRVKMPMLTATMKQKRLERGLTAFLTIRKNHGNRIVIFSDEKTFTVDFAVNKLNDRIVSFGCLQPTSGLCDDVWSRRIEWRKDAPSVVLTWVYRLTAAAYKDIFVTKIQP